MFQLIGYEIHEKIYDGKHTKVYSGRRLSDDQKIAFKMLQNEYPSLEQVAGLKKEFRILQQLEDQGTIKAFDLKPHKNSYILILELFGPDSLQTYMGKKKIQLKEALEIAIMIVENLEKIHLKHIIHKDINPSNILWDETKRALKIIDFNIAIALKKETAQALNPNVLSGTLHYLSPEQTGRMNRVIDYRSDYYSLGVTFYQLFTGVLPFQIGDPMALVNAHITKIPKSPHEHSPHIPLVVSDIIMRLLAKTAEERYKSLYGLKCDLKRALQQLEEKRHIDDFEIGQKDMTEQFLIPEKLYGRENEIEQLLSAFSNASYGKAQLLLVSGYSGIGKTSVIDEIHKPIVAANGFFVSGKFDQLKHNTPYSALINAMQELVKQILCEAEASIFEWKAKILGGVGHNAQLMIDIIPMLQQIIGPQPEVLEVNPAEAQSRFTYTFKNFIQALTSKAHPLVIFLDDLQWADISSLNALELLFESNLEHILIIGAYRNNEVNDSHPLILSLDKIKSLNTPVTHLVLKPLQKDAVNQLLSETLNRDKESVLPLTNVCYQKTEGNPFFLIQFLEALSQEKLIYFNFDSAFWQWSLSAINARKSTDNVVEFMLQKIQKLCPDTNHMLQIATCLGNVFDLQSLANISDHSMVKSSEKIWQALEEGLILPLDDNYGLISGDANINASYRFFHDRAQQAFHSLLPESEKTILNLKIARFLWQKYQNDKNDELLFDLVNHFNMSIDLLNDACEREMVAQLNLEAGKRAKNSVANLTALTYFQTGIQLLDPEKAWDTHYQLILDLYTEAASVSYLSKQLDEATLLCEHVIQRTKNIYDQIKTYETKIYVLTAKHELTKAEQTVAELHRKLGLKSPRRITKLNLVRTFLKTRMALRGLTEKEYLNLPPMIDPKLLALCRAVINTQWVVFSTNPFRAFYNIMHLIREMVKHGSNDDTGMVYASYGTFLCAIGHIEEGFKFGQLANQFLNGNRGYGTTANVYILCAVFIDHWKRPIKESLPKLLKGYTLTMEEGNAEQASIISYTYPGILALTGIELSKVMDSLKKFLPVAESYDHLMARNANRLLAQRVECSLGLGEGTKALCGSYYNATKNIPELKRIGDRSTLSFIHFGTMLMNYIHNHYLEAYENMVESKKYFVNLAPLPQGFSFTFHESLIICQLWQSFSSAKKISYLYTLWKNIKRLEKLSRLNLADRINKYYLVKAEMYRIFGFKDKAAIFYDLAIDAAKTNEIYSEAAKASELAAHFYLDQHKERIAKLYMFDAYYTYRKWGGLAKMQQLEKDYPYLQSFNTNESGTFTVDTITTMSGSSNFLDISTVIKASQAIAREIVLSTLLEKLMRIVAESAGAVKSYLLLEHEGIFTIDATIEDNTVTVMQNLSTKKFPQSVVQYVTNSKEIVLLDDARKPNQFTSDPYLLNHPIKSMLCIPLLNQGDVTGVLYFENNLTTSAFTKDRVELLNLLSTQISISISNAILYDHILDLNKAYQRFVPKEFLSLLAKKSITEVAIGDQIKKEMTVIFCDIRDFTSSIEKMSPEESISFVNQFLQRMEPIITQHRGFIDKYIGDAIMAIFPVCADDALQCGIAMLKELEHFNHERKDPIHIGIGINTGLLMLGTVGSAIRIEATVISDAVNVASRVEGLTKIYQTPLVITENTYRALGNPVDYLLRKIANTTVKGKSIPLNIYEVYNLDSRPVADLKNKTLSSFAKGLEAYHDKNYKTAFKIFKTILQDNPEDLTSKVYFDDCVIHLQSMHLPDKLSP